MNVITRISKAKKSISPSWQGGRVPLTANMSAALRQAYTAAAEGTRNDIELTVLKPLFELQAHLSHVPLQDETLIEHIEARDGFHLFVYPFEGRLVHEVMAYLLAYRISRIVPITFSIAMNDYGFDLLSDQPIPIDRIGIQGLFSTANLLADIQHSINATEIAKRKFRPIAVIAGLVFRGYPGAPVKNKHLQSSSSLLFSVFNEHEPKNLLLKQSFTEAFDEQIEEVRLRTAMERIYNSTIIVKYPSKLTPLSFPIKVDSMRENMSSEDLRTRVLKMQKQLEKT
jgi:ATP-dependent Lhr-like helicase